MKISQDRIAHMHGVAEWMHDHAKEFNCKNPNDMYYLGLIHDIGYLMGAEQHEENGAQIIGNETYYGHLVINHGLTPKEYMDKYLISACDIPSELILLWTADMMIDTKGNEIGFDKRLEDIANRHGKDSDAYIKSKARIEWLKRRKELEDKLGD